ncbi:hypothetical protein ABKN59_011048 [Abortiporus biennis]
MELEGNEHKLWKLAVRSGTIMDVQPLVVSHLLIDCYGSMHERKLERYSLLDNDVMSQNGLSKALFKYNTTVTAIFSHLKSTAIDIFYWNIQHIHGGFPRIKRVGNAMITYRFQC